MLMLRRSSLTALALVTLLIRAETSTAATASSNFNVMVSVGTSCTIAVAANLNFGTYDPTAPLPTDNQTTMNVTCTLATPATIDINQGSNPGPGSTADAPLRYMADGTGQFLAYALYQDA